jgi:hypothetical protein
MARYRYLRTFAFQNRAKANIDALLERQHLQKVRRETCVERYYRGDGTSFRGPGFLSLLGALYLQMSNFRDAEDITYCKWCGEVVNFEQCEPPPSDAPKGARTSRKRLHLSMLSQGRSRRQSRRLSSFQARTISNGLPPLTIGERDLINGTRTPGLQAPLKLRTFPAGH